MLESILIIGSDADNIQQTKCSISDKLKYKVVLASSISHGMNIINSPNSNISLVLLDIKLLKQEKIDFIRELKLKRPDFPIIVFVEYGQLEFAMQAIDAGANDFLTKPIALERLALSIESALRISYLSLMVKKLEKQLQNDGIISSQSAPFYVINSAQYGKDVKIKKLKNLEEDAIRFALKICDGSMSKAAHSLGIGRSTLYRKLGEINRNKNSQMIRENQTTRPMMVKSVIEHS